MTLHGLPESPLPPGCVLLTSLISALVSAAGLVLLRNTRPTKVVELSRTNSLYGGLPPWYVYNILGIFGALLLYLGLVFGSFPMLMGVSTDDEGKAAAIVQCSQVLLCWLMERYYIVGHALPMMQSCACAIVWFGSTLVEWAAPRPYDNISPGLNGQVSGCDGGYRSPFLVYATGCLTAMTFGVLFLLTEDKRPNGPQSIEDRRQASEAAVPRVAACKILPAIYGLSLAMSGMVFGLGTSRNDMAWVAFGAILLVIAVVCAWEWLWCMEHSLVTWAAVSQCFTSVCRLGQAHLVFRDFRWDPDSVTGILVIWRWPGLQLFLCGFVLLMTVVQVWNNTCTWSDWWVPSERHAPQPSPRKGPEKVPMSRASLMLYILQWLLLPLCMFCCLTGVSSPLVESTIFIPEVKWLADEAAIESYKSSTRPGTGHEIKHGKSYLDLISSLYAGRVPCSALVVAYNSVVCPPLQFAGFFLVLLGKGRFIKIREGTMEAVKHFTLHQAPMRFTNPMVLMTGVAVIQLTAPSGKMEAGFTQGYWYFIAYVCICLFLAWSLNLDLDGDDWEGKRKKSRNLELPIGPNAEMKVRLARSSSRLRNEDTYNEDDGTSDMDEHHVGLYEFLCSKFWEVLAILALLPTIAISMYLGLTRPFLIFDYRLSGIKVQEGEPSVVEIWESLGSKSHFLKYFSAITLIATLVVWVVLLGLRVLSKGCNHPHATPRFLSQFVAALELIVRPWVLGHVWAFCLALVYYIVTARNKAPIEVCAHFPRTPVGFISIIVMGGSVVALQHFGKELVDPPQPTRHGLKLPGGNWLWYCGAAVVGCFWLAVLWTHGPTLPPEISSLTDFNDVLSRLLPVTNAHLHAQIPESSGDCQALWEHRIENGKALFASPPSEVHRACRGTAPLVQQKQNSGTHSMEVIAKWATGLNSLELMDARVFEPANITQFTQEFNMTVKVKFSDLHVWLKVLLGKEERVWVDDYMCCDNPFHFTLEASVRCTLGQGFHPIQLHAPHVDHINFKHRVEVEKTQDSSMSWNIDYGRSSNVEQALRMILTGKRGKLLIKNSDGSTTDPLASASDVLNSIVYLNTGQQCLYQW